MILFLVIVPLLALLTPVLAVILFRKNKKHKAEIDALTASNITLSNQLSECQEKLSQALREHSESEGKIDEEIAITKDACDAK